MVSYHIPSFLPTCQVDLRSLYDLLTVVARQKDLVPKWLGPLVVRALWLVGFTGAVIFVRVKIMKAELPVFTV